LIPWLSQTKRIEKLVFTASLLDVQHLKGCGERPTSSLVVSLSKALNGIASTFEWLDSKTEKVTLLSPGRGTLTNK